MENVVTYTQQWDAENRLVRVSANGQTTQFFYDGACPEFLEGTAAASSGSRTP